MEGFRFNQPSAFARAQGISEYDTITVKSGSAEAKSVFLERLLRVEDPDIVIPVLCRDALEATSKLKAELGFKVIYPTHEYHVDVQNDIQEMSNSLDHIVTVDQLYMKYLEHSLENKNIRISQVPTSYPNHLLLDRQPTQTPFISPLDIGFCGRLNSDQKQASTLINVIQRFSNRDDIRFHWLGENSESLRSNRLCEIAINEGRLIPHGSLYGKDIRLFFEKIDCALICSTWETGPIFAWEAMAAGKLLITSSYLGSEVEDLLHHDDNCLVYEIGNTDQCYQLISDIQIDYERAQRIIKKAFEDIKKFRSPTAERSGWLEVLERYSSNTQRKRGFSFHQKRLMSVLKCWYQRSMETLRLVLLNQYAPSSALSEWQQHIPSGKAYQLFLEELAAFESKLSKDNK